MTRTRARQGTKTEKAQRFAKENDRICRDRGKAKRQAAALRHAKHLAHGEALIEDELLHHPASISSEWPE